MAVKHDGLNDREREAMPEMLERAKADHGLPSWHRLIVVPRKHRLEIHDLERPMGDTLVRVERRR